MAWGTYFLQDKPKSFTASYGYPISPTKAKLTEEPSPRRHIYADQDSTDGCPAVLRNMGGRTGCGLHEHKSDSTEFSKSDSTEFSNKYDNDTDDHDHCSTRFIAIRAVKLDGRPKFSITQ
jgi:hypothetical protein